MNAPVILPGGARSIMASRREPPKSLDPFWTPPWAMRALLQVLRERGLVLPWQTAWDPCCGQGHMAGPLQELFAAVYSTDVFAHGGVREPDPPGWYGLLDFLDEDAPSPVQGQVDWLFLNPPFNAAGQFAIRALQLARVGVAMILPTIKVAGEDRHAKLFGPYPPSLIVQWAERVPMHRGRWLPNGSTATDYMALVWVHERRKAAFIPQRDPAFVWLPPGQKRRFLTAEDVRRYAWAPNAPLFDGSSPSKPGDPCDEAGADQERGQPQRAGPGAGGCEADPVGMGEDGGGETGAGGGQGDAGGDRENSHDRSSNLGGPGEEGRSKLGLAQGVFAPVPAAAE